MSDDVNLSIDTETAEVDTVRVYSETPPQSILRVVPGPAGFSIYFGRPMPNRFHRFWQKALLGWVWEKP